jgi:hypothetical protein
VLLCLQIATDVLNKLPQEFELDKIRKKFGVEITPTTVVLLQELERFNILIGRMRRSLATLKRVCIMSDRGSHFTPILPIYVLELNFTHFTILLGVKILKLTKHE